MTFHLRDIVRLFRGFGAATEGQVLSYNEETQRPEWRDAAGGEGGGESPLRVVVLDTAVDITDNASWTDVITVEAERHSKYFITGFIPVIGVENTNVDVMLSVPDGEFIGTYTVSTFGGSASLGWDGSRVTGLDFGSPATVFHFSGVLVTTGDEVTVKLRAAQSIADPETTEIPVGTFLTITKAQ